MQTTYFAIVTRDDINRHNYEKIRSAIACGAFSDDTFEQMMMREEYSEFVVSNYDSIINAFGFASTHHSIMLIYSFIGENFRCHNFLMWKLLQKSKSDILGVLYYTMCYSSYSTRKSESESVKQYFEKLIAQILSHNAT